MTKAFVSRKQLSGDVPEKTPPQAVPDVVSPLQIHFGDNLQILQTLPDACVGLVYIDPPFNTGRAQARTRIAATQDAMGERVGFQGKRYAATRLASSAHSYADKFGDYIGFLRPRLLQAKRVLRPNGSLFFHIDYREAHYCKILLDDIFGRDSFMNEIVWAYDYGARATKKWSAKHDTIFWYANSPNNYVFNYDDIDRIPYMAPGLVGPEKAARGKTPTDVWWHTIVSPNGREKTGYPTQKPRGIIDRIVRVHSAPQDILCDFFAGSGTLGESALAHGRRCILMDSNPQAMEVMQKRFAATNVNWHGWTPRHNQNATQTKKMP